VGVDDDLQLDHAGGSRCRHAYVWTCLFAGTWGLPEDDGPSSCGREHDLGAVLAAPVGHHVDRPATSGAGPQRDALDELGFLRPLRRRHRVAVEGARTWPGALGPKDQALAERQAQEVGQGAVGVGVPGDQQFHAASVAVLRPGSAPHLVVVVRTAVILAVDGATAGTNGAFAPFPHEDDCNFDCGGRKSDDVLDDLDQRQLRRHR